MDPGEGMGEYLGLNNATKTALNGAVKFAQIQHYQSSFTTFWFYITWGGLFSLGRRKKGPKLFRAISFTFFIKDCQCSFDSRRNVGRFS